MKPIMRTYQTEEDYWSIREFLRELSMSNCRHDFAWSLLRRAQKLGATLATVSSYSTGAHALYESMGFTEVDLLEPWIKEW